MPLDPAVVTEADLHETVARMEQRWLQVPEPAVAELVEAYSTLMLRFEVDLQVSTRDVLLAKASALMLIQEVARARAV